MAEYIEREAALEAIRNLYPGIPFTKRLMQKWHEENRNFMQCETAIEKLTAADVVPVVRCKDCVYWQKPQIMLDDGTCRDYMDGESVGMVSISVGINIGSHCELYDRDHKNRIPQFMGPDDFCSKGYKAKMDGEA